MNTLYNQATNYNTEAINTAAYAQIRAELEKNGYTSYSAPMPIPQAPEPISFSQLVKFWLMVKESTVRANSSEGYAYIAEAHVIPYFDAKGKHVHNITAWDIYEYFTYMNRKYKASTLDKHYTVINGALDFAMRHLNMIYYNPAANFKKPKKEIRIYNYYNEDELSELLSLIEGHVLEAPVLLAASFGLRRSEVLGLKWSAIAQGFNSITIQHTVCRTKSGCISGNLTKEESSYRSFTLSSEVSAYLRKLYDYQKQCKLDCKEKYNDNDYICKHDNGNPIKPGYITREFPKYLEKNGLKKIRFHDLRHSAASALLNAGFSLAEICKWLGHADIKSTKRYLHLDHKSTEQMCDYMGEFLFWQRKSKKYGSENIIG